MTNSIGHLMHEPKWFETSDGKVPGVDAPPDIRSIEQAANVVARFDQRAQVWMDCLY